MLINQMMSYIRHENDPKKSAKEITVKLDKLNVEDALYMLRFLKGKNKTILHLYFRNMLFYPFSLDDELESNNLKQFLMRLN